MAVDRGQAHAVVGERLRGAGQLYTSGRRELVDLLLDIGRPATMADVLGQRPALVQSSVYRNMADLERTGIVRRVAGSDELIRVELAEEIIGHHHHLVCTQCGTVADFTVPEAAERALRDALQRIAREGSFVPEDHRLDVLGRCRPCSREHTTK